MIMKSLNFIYTIFLRLHDFSVFVLISYIGIVFLYRLTCLYLMCYLLPCCLLSPAWYHLLSCYHLTSGMIYLTLIIIRTTGMMTWHLDYILIYSSTNHTPDDLTSWLHLDIFQYKSYAWYTYIPDTHDMFLLIPKIW